MYYCISWLYSFDYDYVLNELESSISITYVLKKKNSSCWEIIRIHGFIRNHAKNILLLYHNLLYVLFDYFLVFTI